MGNLPPVSRQGEGGQTGLNARKTQKSKKLKGDSSDLNELDKKDEIIKSLEYRVNILQLKISKLEQLVSLKDHKIQFLESSMKGG